MNEDKEVSDEGEHDDEAADERLVVCKQSEFAANVQLCGLGNGLKCLASFSAWLLFAYFHALCDWVDQFCESEFVFQLAFGFRCLVFGAKLLCSLLVCAFLGCSLLLLDPWTLNFCVGLWLAMVAMVSALTWPLLLVLLCVVGQLWLAFGFICVVGQLWLAFGFMLMLGLCFNFVHGFNMFSALVLALADFVGDGCSDLEIPMAADFVGDGGVPSANPDGPYHLEIPMAEEFSCAYRSKELLREIKRTLDRSIREIKRERQGLQNQEKKLITEIKKSAKLRQMDAIFRVVAGILHLGNIEFSEGKETDSSTPKDEKSYFHLRTAAELFMCDEKALEDSLCKRIIVTRYENITKCLDPDTTALSRDALAKIVYSQLFDWLMNKINNSIGQDPNSKVLIGMLDIYGFELSLAIYIYALCSFLKEKPVAAPTASVELFFCF
ncbi:uncharacterized protein A4U43_C06F13360 [Asparagus officinalis]|uniref:Myosin motor domain-containing protein n=1 Tax=Asparagus officinalis TaxID=4686 RepID=A0A5P1ELM2_ASPOF|nr:uncharacterized protein A4U43_C06F13360 [Asparagus officinalis]